MYYLLSLKEELRQVLVLVFISLRQSIYLLTLITTDKLKEANQASKPIFSVWYHKPKLDSALESLIYPYVPPSYLLFDEFLNFEDNSSILATLLNLTMPHLVWLLA